MSKIDYKHIIERQIRECEELIFKSETCDSITKSQCILFQRLEKPRIKVAKSRIDNLKEALRRFDDDRFGICKICKKEIADRDLLALPERKSCMSCSGYSSKYNQDRI